MVCLAFYIYQSIELISLRIASKYCLNTQYSIAEFMLMVDFENIATQSSDTRMNSMHIIKCICQRVYTASVSIIIEI